MANQQGEKSPDVSTLRCVPKPERFKKPVGWLLSRQLVSGLKQIILYSVVAEELNSKDWMRPRVITFKIDEATDSEFWFDYLADTGDGQMATYSIAYLCLSDLGVRGSPDVDSEVEVEQGAGGVTKLPRGAFLFVGGDTSYHVADYKTLVERFQNPFCWAFEDLKERGKVSDEDRRPLFGIPGNHDYYDTLDGFNRQFRRPLTKEDEKIEGPQLSLRGFKRCQEASYVALRLPFGWWLWGVDAPEGKIDRRQQAFFNRLSANGPPKKLIVATPEPTTVFGKYEKKGSTRSGLFERLRLKRPFLGSGEEQLSKGECRLDLSGDVHHYARYWGPARAGVVNSAPSMTNYASVVSGLGGAFVHPSHTDVGEVKKQAVYPKEDVSRTQVASRLLNPWVIFRGGYIWLVGAIVALVTYFAATVAPSTQRIVDGALKLVGVSEDRLPLPAEGLFYNLRRYTFELGQMEQRSLFAQALTDVEWLLVLLSTLFTVVCPGVAWVWGHFLFKQARKRKVAQGEYRWLAGALMLAVAWYFVIMYVGAGTTLGPFLSSFLVLVFLAFAVLALIWRKRYKDSLARQAKIRQLADEDNFLLWLLPLYAVASVFFGLWQFGRYSAAVLLSDLTFTIVVLGVVGGLIAFAAAVGGKLYGVAGRTLFALLGAVHGVVQLVIPFLLVRVGTWQTILVALVSVAAAGVAGWRLVVKKPNWDRWLIIPWLILSAGLILLPLYFSGSSLQSQLGSYWLTLIIVFFLGAFMSIVSLGWYFAVSLAFNGHNNEAGGAARIERFKQFIRFRLRENDLTGFVIAVDDPQTEGSKLKPRLVDVFTLSV